MSFLLGFRLLKAHKIFFFYKIGAFANCVPHLGDIQKIRSLKIPEFWSPFCSLVRPCFFLSTPLSPRCFGWNSPSRPQFLYLWYLDKRNYNEYYYLLSHSEISVKWTPLVHDKSVGFMEMSAFRVHLKIRSLQKQTRNPLPVMIFQVQIYWKD